MPRKVLVAFPPAMLEQMDFVAKQEHRTRSDLIREAVRRYMEQRSREVAYLNTKKAANE